MGAAGRVGDLLEQYAARGAFSGFSRHEHSAGNAEYRLWWHRRQCFQWQWNEARQTLRIACVLPAVPGDSTMYRDFKTWLRARQAPELPVHRRCDPDRVALKTYNRAGDIALTMQVLDGGVDDAVHRLVHLVNEIYQDFLSSGLYFEWLVETFDLDPDNPY